MQKFSTRFPSLYYDKSMNLIAYSLAGLLALFFLSHFTGFIMGIRDDRFYSPFHFVGGMLSGFFFYGLTHSFALSIVLTMAIGVAWEIYEVLLWKYLLKQRKFKPKKDDTKNDLVLDFFGSLATVALTAMR